MAIDNNEPRGFWDVPEVTWPDVVNSSMKKYNNTKTTFVNKLQ